MYTLLNRTFTKIFSNCFCIASYGPINYLKKNTRQIKKVSFPHKIKINQTHIDIRFNMAKEIIGQEVSDKRETIIMFPLVEKLDFFVHLEFFP